LVSSSIFIPFTSAASPFGPADLRSSDIVKESGGRGDEVDCGENGRLDEA